MWGREMVSVGGAARPGWPPRCWRLVGSLWQRSARTPWTASGTALTTATCSSSRKMRSARRWRTSSSTRGGRLYHHGRPTARWRVRPFHSRGGFSENRRWYLVTQRTSPEGPLILLVGSGELSHWHLIWKAEWLQSGKRGWNVRAAVKQ